MYNGPMNKYIKKVTKNMGIKQREEVACELKTHILDSADAIAAEKNVEVDDSIIRAVILRMGSPENVADMYPVETTVIDNLINVLKIVGRFTFNFIIISSVIWIALSIYFYDKLQFDKLTLSIFSIVYMIVLVIHLTIRFKLFSKLLKR